MPCTRGSETPTSSSSCSAIRDTCDQLCIHVHRLAWGRASHPIKPKHFAEPRRARFAKHSSVECPHAPRRCRRWTAARIRANGGHVPAVGKAAALCTLALLPPAPHFGNDDHCVHTFLRKGHSADGKSKHTDGQVWGSLNWPRRLAIDVSVVNPTAVSHSGAGACGESFLNPNAGTKAAEETKPKKHKLLCERVVWTSYRLSSQRVEGW